MGNLKLPDTLLDGSQYNKKLTRILEFLNNKYLIDTEGTTLPYEGQQWWDSANDKFKVWDGLTWQELSGSGSSPTLDSLTVNKGAVINESGGDYDTRIEGDTDVNLLFADASADKVGFGKNNPAYKVDIVGSIGLTENIVMAATKTVDGVDVSEHNHNGANQGGTVSHTYLSDKGTKTHAQIDTHIANTSNPHSVTKAQVGLTNVTDNAQLKIATQWNADIGAKATPIGADLLLIEDSADSFAKKKCTITQAMGTGVVTSFNTRTGAVVPATNDYTWAQINKATSSIADITTRSHTALSDIGTNTHAQIDTHIGAAENYLLLQPAANVVINEAGSDYDFRIETVGNANAFVLDAGASTISHGCITLFADDVKVAQAKKVYLDTDLHSYITCAGADVMDFYTAGAKALSIDAGGQVGHLLQSGFYACFSTGAGQTIEGAEESLVFQTELYDRYAEYNPATGIFTAKATGLYLMGFVLRYENADGKRFGAWINKNAGTVRIMYREILGAGTGYDTIEGVALVSVTANNYFWVSTWHNAGVNKALYDTPEQAGFWAVRVA